MKAAIVVGTGGHSRVVLSMLEAAAVPILGLIDVGVPKADEYILGFPVLGAIDQLGQFCGRTDVDVYLAIGDNVRREALYNMMSAQGFSFPNLVANSAHIDRHAGMGEANIICARAHIGPQAALGNNNLVNTGAVVEHETVIDSHCHLAPGSIIRRWLGQGRLWCAISSKLVRSGSAFLRAALRTAQTPQSGNHDLRLHRWLS